MVVAEELEQFDAAGTVVSCPGRGAAFFMPLRRAGTIPDTALCRGPRLAAHHVAKVAREQHIQWAQYCAMMQATELRMDRNRKRHASQFGSFHSYVSHAEMIV